MHYKRQTVTVMQKSSREDIGRDLDFTMAQYEFIPSDNRYSPILKGTGLSAFPGKLQFRAVANYEAPNLLRRPIHILSVFSFLRARKNTALSKNWHWQLTFPRITDSLSLQAKN